MENYASAPYNFIPFPKSVVYRHFIKECIEESDKPKLKAKDIDELIYHDKFYSNLKTGYIDYRIVTKSPMFIGDGKGNFFKVNNEYTIPGSTMRGRVRSNAEVLSCAYPEFINDKKLWYRAPFAKTDDVLKELYRSALSLNKKGAKITDKVKAGYLTNKNGKYTIIPAVEDEDGKSFRDINEGELIKKFKKSGVNDGLVSYMYKSNNNDLWNKIDELKVEKKNLRKELKEKIDGKEKKKLTEEEKSLEEAIQGKINGISENIKKSLKYTEDKKYSPYYVSVDYEINSESNELSIKTINKFSYNEEYGILMNSSKVNGSNKQNHYIIYKPDKSKREFSISKRLKAGFDTNVRYSLKHIPKQLKLPNSGEAIPVFYVIDKEGKEVESFGFTPYLKIAYKSSVLDGVKVKEEFKGKCVDYVQGIFGFTNFKSEKGEISYKGRVKFTNAKLISHKENIDEIFKALMNPKINSFQLYLKQDKNDISSLNTYNEDFELRGQKFYWMHDNADTSDDFKTQLEKVRLYNSRFNRHKKEPKENQFAKLKSINSEIEFKGRIYFENLSCDELGLLLMSLKPYDQAVDNIGQGKPYGFGKINIDILDAKEIKMLNRFKKLNCNECEDINIGKCKNAFENQMQKNLGCDLKDTDIYKCFYLSKNNKQIPKNYELKYMDVKDFGKRKILKPIEKYVEEHKEEIQIEELSAIDLENESFKEYAASKFALNDRIKFSKGRRKDK